MNNLEVKFCTFCNCNHALTEEFWSFLKSGRIICRIYARHRALKNYYRYRDSRISKMREYKNANKASIKERKLLRIKELDQLTENSSLLVECKHCKTSHPKTKEYWVFMKDKKLRCRAEQYSYNKNYREINSERLKESKYAYGQNNKKLTNQRAKERRRTNINYKIKCALRSRISIAVQRNLKMGSSVATLGCTIEELRYYLEAKFKDGMSWANYGHKGWHIDHIRPLAQFDLSDSEQFKIACHYSNLQPLWARENLQKGCKVLD